MLLYLIIGNMLLNILILVIHFGNKTRLTLRSPGIIPISISQAVTYIIQYEKFCEIYISHTNKFHIPKNKIANFQIFLRLNHS